MLRNSKIILLQVHQHYIVSILTVYYLLIPHTL